MRFKPLLLSALLVAASSSALAQIPLPPLPRIEFQVVQSPPPYREPRERRDRRPDRDHVWRKGYWDHQDSAWTWVDGRWDRPPVARATWIQAEHTRIRGQWYYIPAHWSNQEVSPVEGYQPRHR